MWSLRRTPRSSPTPLRASLRLESLDLRLSPSSLIDDKFIPVFDLRDSDAANRVPEVVDFQAVQVVGGLWRFTGKVIDEAPAGLTVSFGGVPVSLQNETTTTDTNGRFDVALLLKTDGSDNGLASAQTVDGAGLRSELALYNISPG